MNDTLSLRETQLDCPTESLRSNYLHSVPVHYHEDRRSAPFCSAAPSFPLRASEPEDLSPMSGTRAKRHFAAGWPAGDFAVRRHESIRASDITRRRLVRRRRRLDDVRVRPARGLLARATRPFRSVAPRSGCAGKNSSHNTIVSPVLSLAMMADAPSDASRRSWSVAPCLLMLTMRGSRFARRSSIRQLRKLIREAAPHGGPACSNGENPAGGAACPGSADPASGPACSDGEHPAVAPACPERLRSRCRLPRVPPTTRSMTLHRATAPSPASRSPTRSVSPSTRCSICSAVLKGRKHPWPRSSRRWSPRASAPTCRETLTRSRKYVNLGVC